MERRSAVTVAAPSCVADSGGICSALLLCSALLRSARCLVLRSHVFMIRKGVVQHDPRLLTRVLRQLTAIRGRLTTGVLRALTKQYLPPLTATLQEAQVSSSSSSTAAATATKRAFTTDASKHDVASD